MTDIICPVCNRREIIELEWGGGITCPHCEGVGLMNRSIMPKLGEKWYVRRGTIKTVVQYNGKAYPLTYPNGTMAPFHPRDVIFLERVV